MFYFLASILLFAGLRVVTARHPVVPPCSWCCRSLPGPGCGCCWRPNSWAITLVLVYIGAVMVLFLFVVMMLNLNIEKMRQGFWDNLPLAAFVGILMAIEMTLVLTVVRPLPVTSEPVSHAAG